MGGSGPDSLPPSTIPTGQAPGMAVSTPNMTSGLNGLNGAPPDPAIMDGLPKVSNKFYCRNLQYFKFQGFVIY